MTTGSPHHYGLLLVMVFFSVIPDNKQIYFVPGNLSQFSFYCALPIKNDRGRTLHLLVRCAAKAQDKTGGLN